MVVPRGIVDSDCPNGDVWAEGVDSGGENDVDYRAFLTRGRLL